MIEKMILLRNDALCRTQNYEIYHEALVFDEDLTLLTPLAHEYDPQAVKYLDGCIKRIDLGLGEREFAWFEVSTLNRTGEPGWYEVDLEGHCCDGRRVALDIDSGECTGGRRYHGEVECEDCGYTHECESEDADYHDDCPYAYCEGGNSYEWMEDVIWVRKISHTFKYPVTIEELKRIRSFHINLNQGELEL